MQSSRVELAKLRRAEFEKLYEVVTIEGCRLHARATRAYVFEVPDGRRVTVPRNAVCPTCPALVDEGGGDLVVIKAIANKYNLTEKPTEE